MTILLISHSVALNGAQRSLLDLAIGLKEQGEDFLVLCPGEGPLTDSLQKENIPVEIRTLLRPQRNLYHLLRFLLLWAPTVWQLRRWLFQKKISVVYNNTIDGLYGPFAAWIAHIPCVWHVREVKPKGVVVRRLFTEMLRRLSAVTVFNSSATMQAYQYSDEKPIQWHVIYNGIDFANLTCSPMPEREAVVVGYAAQMVPHKRPDRFLEVLAAARQKVSQPLRGMMAGSGVWLPFVRQQAQELGLSDYIEIPGHVENMMDFYQNIDLFMLTSDYEPFGRVLVEAMAACRPVIAACVGGVPEVVVDEVTGYLVPADDIDAYVSKIVILATHSELRSRMAKAGREHVLANFTIEVYCQRLIAVLKQVATASETTTL